MIGLLKFIYKSTNLAYNEATIRACRLVWPSREWKHGQNGRNGVPYSLEVARFALFGGRLPKVKVLTADVPINVNLRSTIVKYIYNFNNISRFRTAEWFCGRGDGWWVMGLNFSSGTVSNE